MVPFAVLGGGCVIAGGLVAAATAPAPSVHGAWAAAYLVLVAGVAQIALGAGQALLAPIVPSRRWVLAQIGAWNAGNAAVLAGTLGGVTPLVDVGGTGLVIGLTLLVAAVRGTAVRGAAVRDVAARLGARWGCWPLYGFRLLVLVLAVSIPIGLILARVGPT